MQVRVTDANNFAEGEMRVFDIAGTHFAAWEQPELFVGEMRASFKSLRK
jgi:hypothetical protein